MRSKKLVGGLGKLVLGIVVAAIGGVAIGTGVGQLSGESDNPMSPTATATTGKKPTKGVQVRIVSAILHPAGSRSGRRRQRARLSVHVRVTNGGRRRVVPSRPVLVSGDVRLKTDRTQDSPATHLRALRRGKTADVTLRFETAGAVTERLREELRARMIIARKNVTTSVVVGGPITRPA